MAGYIWKTSLSVLALSLMISCVAYGNDADKVQIVEYIEQDKGDEIRRNCSDVPIEKPLHADGYPLPIHFAAYSGSEDAMLALIECGADVNVEPIPRSVPLHSAILGEQPGTAQLLASQGANVDAVFPGGLPAVTLAVDKSIQSEKDCGPRYEIARTLITHGAELNTGYSEDGSDFGADKELIYSGPLFSIHALQSPEWAAIVVAKGADPNISWDGGSDSESTLERAERRGNERMLIALEGSPEQREAVIDQCDDCWVTCAREWLDGRMEEMEREGE